MRIGEAEIAIIDVITFTGILITLLTGMINLFQNKKTLYINNITKFRVIWITTLRNHIASLKELSNITNLYIRTKNGTDKIKYRRELERVVSLIKMHLNFSGRLDTELIYKVEELKATINSYLLMHYYKNTMKYLDKDSELLSKFNEIIDVISEKKILGEFLKTAINDDDSEFIKRKISLLELRDKVKSFYIENPMLIRKMIYKSNNIINSYENEIENLNMEIDEIVQIYLKAEWIRCKIETKIWPYNKYDEKKIIEKLKNDYKNTKQ